MQQHFSSTTLESSVKILVLGDSGVGKSSLVHALCHDEPLRSSIPTVGCHIDVRLHSSTVPTAAATSGARSTIPSLLSRSNPVDPSSFSSGVGASEPIFIEFYDISGSPAVRHQKSRNMFYKDISYQGIILVHDLCNRRSYENLWKWMGDYLESSHSVNNLPRWSSQRHDNLGFNGGSYLGSRNGDLDIPLLVVGTKNDMATTTLDQQKELMTSFGQALVEKYGGEAISVCTISPAEFMPNSSTLIAFNMFFNRIIDPRAAGSSRLRNPSHSSNTGLPSSPSSYPRPPPTPTPGEELPERNHHRQHSRQHHNAYSNTADVDETGSSSIPIMDFATFTGGSLSSSASEYQHRNTPPRSMSPLGQGGDSDSALVRPVTPTGFSSTLSTKSALRAQYERNRSVLSQYNSSMGVPIYTNSTRKGNSSIGGSR